MRQPFTFLCQLLNIHPGKVVHGSASLCYSLNYRSEILSRFTRFTFFYQSFSSQFLYRWNFGPSNLQNGSANSVLSYAFSGPWSFDPTCAPGGSKPPLNEGLAEHKCKAVYLFSHAIILAYRQGQPPVAPTEIPRLRRPP